MSNYPYIYNSDNNYHLVLTENQYLHWFRGYGFQIAFNPQADGEYCSSYGKMHVLNKCMERRVRHEIKQAISEGKAYTYEPGWIKSGRSQLFVMEFMGALCGSLEGRDLLRTNPKLINEYLSKVKDKSNIESVTLDDFTKYMTVKDSEDLPDINEMSSNGITMFVYFDDEYDAVIILRKNWMYMICKYDFGYRTYTYEYPEWFYEVFQLEDSYVGDLMEDLFHAMFGYAGKSSRGDVPSEVLKIEVNYKIDHWISYRSNYSVWTKFLRREYKTIDDVLSAAAEDNAEREEFNKKMSASSKENSNGLSMLLGAANASSN